MLDIPLIKERLLNKTFVTWVYYFEEIGSTNDFAKTVNGHDNVLILSEYQSQGRGRFGRKWQSEKGQNLMFTIKKQFDVMPQQNSYLNFYFSYFLYLAIMKFLNTSFPALNTEGLEIKWPNDILFNSKKIAGILIESPKKNHFIIGFGINVNQKDFDNDFRASSLINFTGQPVNINDLLLTVMNEFNTNFGMITERNFEKIYRMWKSSLKLIGRTVEFKGEGNHIKSAKIIDLNEDGSIKLLVDDQKKTYHNGEIKLLL